MATKYDVLTVREYTTSAGEKKSSWTRIGVMFPARTGDGFSIMLDALPLDGKLVCRVPRERDGNSEGRERGGSCEGRRQAQPSPAASSGGGYSDADYGTTPGGEEIPF